MRMYPVLAGSGWFEAIVTTVGLITVLFAAFIAIFKHDLKGLLAYSTVSHLGLITFLVGLGSPLAAVAAVFHMLNHATFKAALFMIAGIVDHETHSRDMRKLGGLWALMPWTATLAMVAAASMAGVPLTNGFLSKEMFFTEAVVGTTGVWAWLVPAAVTLAGICSVAYSLRFVHDTYLQRPLGDVPNTHPHEPPLGMKLPAMLLVAMCIAVGLLPAITFGPLVDVAATALAGKAAARVPPGDLARLQPAPAHERHRPGGGGGPVPAAGSPQAAAPHRVRGLVGAATGRQILRPPDRRPVRPGGAHLGRLESGSLQHYLAWTLGAAIAVVAVTVLGSGSPMGTGPRELLPASPLAIAIWLCWLAPH
jgi:multicomponent K+:H+ antiporter subunit A